MHAHAPSHDPLGCADCPVREVAVCAGLPEDERAALARLGRRRTFARGESVFAAGDESIACATLVTGALKLARIDPEGVERTVAIVHPSGFLARLFAAPADCTATALAPSELCLFPRDAILREMRAHPNFMERVLRATTEQLDEARALIELIGRRDSHARVAGLLVMFLDGACDRSSRVQLPLTRGEIASLLGLTIETVSRQLSALETGGVIRRAGLKEVEVLDEAALRAAAE